MPAVDLDTPPGYGITRDEAGGWNPLPSHLRTHRSTMAIDEQIQESARRRLAIIEGQLRGLQRMIEEKKYCIDVLTQISAIHEALRGVGKLVVRHHLETCVTEGLTGDDREKHYQELMDLIYKLSK